MAIPLLPFLAFITTWGGAGYILRTVGAVNLALALLAATAVALAVGGLIYGILHKLTTGYDHSMAEEDYQLTGQLGYMSVPAAGGNVGEMKYVLQGTNRSVSVRSERGEELPKGSRVIILRMEKGIATVTRFHEDAYKS